jgi:hypothetical protein
MESARDNCDKNPAKHVNANCGSKHGLTQRRRADALNEKNRRQTFCRRIRQEAGNRQNECIGCAENQNGIAIDTAFNNQCSGRQAMTNS